ncbi:MAG: HsdR family type I site-specific deoxyribonuclease [Succinatimonas sp.]|nr:HsdR family type I site-specific deoxyribonuclease [Succinatimonas sp.]
MPEAEAIIEEKLISQLTTGVSQWNRREDIRTEDDLWKNIRKILNENNKSKLNGVYITDKEMVQIKEFILDQAESPFKAAKWLAGEFGLAQIPLSREDAKLGNILLDAIDNKQIAGGSSVYEVIHQYVSFKTDEKDRERRFDVTLLINGFPMIHIELKNESHGYLQAFNQIKKYIGEGKFTGLFGLVQMFVVSNATDTKYIANAPYNKFSEKYLNSWVNRNNVRVDNYLEFAKEALNIPQAHLLIGKYSIIDETSKSLLLLRPYQIHAIEAVKEASKNQESGYVWHTTGSGKTITSFNVTRNLLDIPSIQKAIFLIDRKDLDQQTTLNFQSYAQNTGDIVEDTENTKALEKCLDSDNRVMIVATRQKLDNLLKKCNNAIKKADKTAYYYKLAERIKQKKIAFIVDECHRAVSSKTKNDISAFFDNAEKKALWYGFTGTPIFKENKKGELGKAARTTDDQYGRCLHQYTIKEALKDKAVLGFKIQSSGFSRDELEEYALKLKIKIPKKGVEKMARITLENDVINAYRNRYDQSIYDASAHRENVIDYICNKSISLLGLRQPRGEAFEGILTCPNIKIAQKYYQEFKEFIAAGKVSEKVKKYCPDFPRIAITYTVGENEDGADVNREQMQQSLDDYNAMFGTHWSLDTINAYNSDLNNRLARKTGLFLDRDNQLDIVIVVDRLLTGFDALPVSTLFVDRPPMSPQGLIQAFSRTNRIFNTNKDYGNIITFQTPAIFKKAIDEALHLYSNGGETSVLAPAYSKTKQSLIDNVSSLLNITDKPAEIDVSGADDEFLKNFVKTFQQVDNSIKAINTYEEWNSENDVDKEKDENGENVYIVKINGLSLTKKELDVFLGKYNNAIDELKRRKKKDDFEDIDINYNLELVSLEEVNFEYLVSLIQRYINAYGDSSTGYVVNDPAIDKYIDSLSKRNSKLGEVVHEVWSELKAHPEEFKGKQAMIVINEKINQIVDSKITEFCNEWCVEKTDMLFFSKYYDGKGELEISNMEKFCYVDKYKERHPETMKLLYYSQVREKARELIVNEIQPLIK